MVEELREQGQQQQRRNNSRPISVIKKDNINSDPSEQNEPPDNGGDDINNQQKNDDKSYLDDSDDQDAQTNFVVRMCRWPQKYFRQLQQEHQIRNIIEKEIELRMDQQKKENENNLSYFQQKYLFFRDFTTISVLISFLLQFLTIHKQFSQPLTFDFYLNHSSWLALTSLHMYAVFSKNPKRWILNIIPFIL